MFVRFLLFLPPDGFKDESLSMVKMFVERWGGRYQVTSYGRKICTGEHGAVCKIDVDANTISPGDYDYVILIDGKGVDRWKSYEHRQLIEFISNFEKEGKPVIAINNAIKIVMRMSEIRGRKIASDDSADLRRFISLFRGIPSPANIEFSGNIVTINGSAGLDGALDKLFKKIGNSQ